MDAAQLEKVRLMAKLKLAVKRTMHVSVDLQALANNPDYAERVLQDIEEKATDEDLLITVLTLREMLVPKRAPRPRAAQPAAQAQEPEQKKVVRDYRFGARGG